MFLVYSLKNKAWRCFSYRTKTILKCENVSIDEKVGSKEKIIDFNSDDEEDNFRIVRQNGEVFFETNNDLQNDVLTIEQRGKQRSETREEIIVEMSTLTSNNNLKKNNPPKKIIGSKDKRVMAKNKVNEEICLISQV